MIGMQLAGLYKFDKAKAKFQSIIPNYIDESGRSNYKTITSIIEDGSGRLWLGFGMRGGTLSEYDKNSDEIIFHSQFTSEAGHGESIGTGRIYDMYMDKTGIIWCVGRSGTLKRFNPETNQGERYRFDRLSSDFVLFSMYEDTKNRIWIGRDSGGLLRFDKQTESYKIYRIRQHV